MNTFSPHVRPWIERVVEVRGEGEQAGSREETVGRRFTWRLSRMLRAIVSEIKAGEQGWSVMVVFLAPERAAISEGRPVRCASWCGSLFRALHVPAPSSRVSLPVTSQYLVSHVTLPATASSWFSVLARSIASAATTPAFHK